RAALAESVLERAQRLYARNAISEEEVDRARAERDIARAEISRVQAIIQRKTIRAPFRARVGLADVHAGQYLNEGTVLTTLQGVADAAHVDFAVAQHVAAALRPGDVVEVTVDGRVQPIDARIVAIDARVDRATRNAQVRARIDGANGYALAPGASVRVAVPAGAARPVVAIPASALRKGPAGDHVFVLARDPDGRHRASVRTVSSGPLLGDEVLIEEGLA